MIFIYKKNSTEKIYKNKYKFMKETCIVHFIKIILYIVYFKNDLSTVKRILM